MGRMPKQDLVIHHSAFKFYPEGFYLIRTKDDKIVRTTLGENEALKRLAQNSGGVVMHTELEEISGVAEDKKIIQRLRRKIEPDAKRGGFRYLLAVHGVGYRLDDPEKSLKMHKPISIFDSDEHLHLHNNEQPDRSRQDDTQNYHEEVVYKKDTIYKNTRFTYDNSDPGFIVVNGLKIQLSRTEHRLLKAFMDGEGSVVSKEYLCSKIAGPHRDKVSGESLRFNIHRLRKKVDSDPKQPRSIQTVRGVGYKLRP